MLDGGILHRREVAEVRQLAAAPYEFSQAYISQRHPESPPALLPLLVTSAAGASMAMRRASAGSARAAPLPRRICITHPHVHALVYLCSELLPHAGRE